MLHPLPLFGARRSADRWPGVRSAQLNDRHRHEVKSHIAAMNPRSDMPRKLAALLAWYRDMGVTEIVQSRPRTWFHHDDTAGTSRGPAPGASLPSTQGRSTHAAPRSSSDAPLSRGTPQGRDRSIAEAHRDARAFPTSQPPDLETAARGEASAAASFADLEAAIRAFDGCGLKTTAKSTCVYRGATRARLVLVGEAPGREEDIEGRPFVGPAGRLLDKMLRAIGFSEADVHITNAVYWRPPGNRTPTPQETMICRPFLERQIELVAPDVVVLLGGPATKSVLGLDEGITRVRGIWHEAGFGRHRAAVVPTLHPAYLLRTPIAKRHVWRDLLAVKARLGGRTA